MSAFSEALSRLNQYNLGVYNAVSNPYGLSGVGGMDANWEPLLADVATVAEAGAAAAGTNTVLLPVLRFVWDGGTADADPGAGKARASTGVLTGGSYTLYVSTTDAAGADVAAALDAMDDSTSAVKGRLRIGHALDPAVWVDLAVTGAVVAGAGYRKVPVTVVAGPGGFAAGAPVALAFLARGDKGETGASGDDPAAIKQGLHTLYFPALALIARTTAGPAPGTTETATNKVMLKSLDFDAATQEHAQYGFGWPKSGDAAAGIMVQFEWTSASGSGGVAFGARARWFRDDDALDAAFGAGVVVTDTLITANDLHVTAVSGAVTPAGTYAAGARLIVEVYRDVAHGSDTLAVDARLLGVRVFYTVAAGTDV